MTPPVVFHRQSFGWCGAYNQTTDFVGFDQLYVQTRWEDAGGNPALELRGWLNNAAFFNCNIVQTGRGDPVQGFALRSGNKHVLGIPLARIGMGTSRASGIGIAFPYNQGGHVGNSILCEFGDLTGQYKHISIETNASGFIICKRGHDNTILGTSDGTVAHAGAGCIPYIMPIGSDSDAPPMTHIEIIPTFDIATGSVKVRVDEQLVLNLIGKNTTNTAVLSTDGTCGIIQPCIGMPGDQAGQTIAEIIVHDASGDVYYGDWGVVWLPADQVGFYTAGTAAGSGSPASKLIAVKDVGTPSGTRDSGTGHFVPNSGADGDVSYALLDDTGVPKAVSMIVKAFPADTKAVREVAPLSLCRKDDGGTSVARVGMRVSGTEVDNGQDIAVPTGYTAEQAHIGQITNPHTNAAWAVTDVIDVFHRRTS